MKKVTLQQIINRNPCADYTIALLEKIWKDNFGRKKYIIVQDCKKLKNKIPEKDLNWLIVHADFLQDLQLHKVGVYVAEKVLYIFEERYADDKRLRAAIQAKKKWLKGKITEKELQDAAYDAHAAALTAHADYSNCASASALALPFTHAARSDYALAHATYNAYIVALTVHASTHNYDVYDVVNTAYIAYTATYNASTYINTEVKFYKKINNYIFKITKQEEV